MGGGREGIREKVQGLRNTNWQVQNRQGELNNSIGNEVAKELICMTHGHELSQEAGIAGRSGVVLGGDGQRGKNWDDCKSIINNIFEEGVKINK